MSSLKKSFVLSFGQKYTELVIAFSSNLILARLLNPEEVGLYSVIAAMTVLAHMLRDFGVSTYIVQEKNLTDSRLKAAQTITMASSFFMGLLFLIFHKEIALFFNRVEVEQVAIFAAVNFFLIPFGSISLSLLRREMQFSTIFKINVSSAFVHATSAIALAYYGFSYMSLAWATILGTSTTVFLSMLHSPKSFFIIPGFRDIERVFRFGWKAFFISLLNQLGNTIPELLTGKFFGMHNVGLYSRASGVVQLFHMGIIQGILPVILPHYVKKIQAGEDLKEDFFRFNVAICCIAWPFFIFVALNAKSILLLLFGEQWIGAAPFLQFLTIAALCRNTFILSGNVFVAKNRIDLQLKLFAISHTIGVMLIILAATQSIELILVAIIVFRLSHLVLSVFYLRKIVTFDYSEIIKTLKSPLLVTAITILPILVGQLIYPQSSSNWFIHLVFSVVCVSLLWGFANFFVSTPIAVEIRTLLTKQKNSS